MFMQDYNKIFFQGHNDKHLPQDRRPALVQESWCGRKQT